MTVGLAVISIHLIYLYKYRPLSMLLYIISFQCLDRSGSIIMEYNGIKRRAGICVVNA